MLGIDIQTVKHIAHLARLDLSEEELANLTRDLAVILQHVNQLKKLDLSDVNPTTHAVVEKCSLRKDTLISSPPLATALQNAPEKEADTFFRVPKVIEK